MTDHSAVDVFPCESIPLVKEQHKRGRKEEDTSMSIFRDCLKYNEIRKETKLETI